MFHHRVFEIVRAFLFVGLLTVTPALEAGESCEGATPMELVGSLRAFAASGESYDLRLDVPTPGILSLDASVPGLAGPEPSLGFVAGGCGPSPVSSQPLLLERSASHLVAAVASPGSYLVRLSASDPRRPLADFKLRSGFVPDEIGNVSAKNGDDDDVIEIEADGLGYAGGNVLSEEDDDVIEIEADGSSYPGSGPGRSLHSKLHQLCRSGEVDDHGDSFTCATFLGPGQRGSGEIGNGWGDDIDMFRFRLGGRSEADLQTVEIETAGEVDTLGGLYDHLGQRLDRAAGGGEGANFRIVTTLRPGTYFVRVEGASGAGGFYTLSVGGSP